MGDIIEAATAILAQAERRVELSGQNIANMTTYGYKRRLSFEQALTAPGAQPQASIDFTHGQPVKTGAAFDLALSGDGFFAVRGADGVLYTRQGQFHRQADGRVVDGQGRPLQLEGGGDVVLKGSSLQVLDDATVLDDGAAIGRLAVAVAPDPRVLTVVGPGLFGAPDGAMTAMDQPSVRQGYLEASNVSTGEEMVAIMESLRRAEAGQRLVGVYDDLMGRALTAFGQQ